MKPEFKIYKKGTTKGMVVICSKEGEPFDKEAKIKKYLMLGYSVFGFKGEKYIGIQL